MHVLGQNIDVKNMVKKVVSPSIIAATIMNFPVVGYSAPVKMIQQNVKVTFYTCHKSLLEQKESVRANNCPSVYGKDGKNYNPGNAKTSTGKKPIEGVTLACQNGLQGLNASINIRFDKPRKDQHGRLMNNMIISGKCDDRVAIVKGQHKIDVYRNATYYSLLKSFQSGKHGIDSITITYRK